MITSWEHTTATVQVRFMTVLTGQGSGGWLLIVYTTRAIQKITITRRLNILSRVPATVRKSAPSCAGQSRGGYFTAWRVQSFSNVLNKNRLRLNHSQMRMVLI